MRRREFIGVLGGAAAWPLAARAQRPNMPVIGILSAGSPDSEGELVAAFTRSLSQAGYVDGNNIALEYRWANNRFDRCPAPAADLARRHVTVNSHGGRHYYGSCSERGHTDYSDCFLHGRRPDQGRTCRKPQPTWRQHYRHQPDLRHFAREAVRRCTKLCRRQVPIAVIFNPTSRPRTRIR